jgi:hypothetical protein
MSLPDNTMHDRIELVRILNEMREAEVENITASSVVEDLSKQDEGRVERARQFFIAGAQISATWGLQTLGLGVEAHYERPDGFAHRPTPIRYRFAARRNLGHRSLTFRDDDE